MAKELPGTDRYLHIDFENHREILIAWKRACLGKFGKGGIRDRAIKILEEDLKKLEASK